LSANVATEPGVGKRIHDRAHPRRKIEQPVFEILSFPPDPGIALTVACIAHFAFSSLHFSFYIRADRQGHWMAPQRQPPTQQIRASCDAAARIFGGICVMQESDTYLAIIDEAQEKCARDAILIFGEVRFGPPTESLRAQLGAVTDLPRLKRMIRSAAKAADWQEILDTP
jgi:hypothetical protein